MVVVLAVVVGWLLVVLAVVTVWCVVVWPRRAARSREEKPLESQPRFLASPGGTLQSPHPVFLPSFHPGGWLAAASWS